MTVSEAHSAFCEVMTLRAEQMLATEGSPYDIATQLCGDVVTAMPDAPFAGHAAYMWGFLTDGLDGPARYARGLTSDQIEALMRQAAREWLAIDHESETELTTYFARWDNWEEL